LSGLFQRSLSISEGTCHGHVTSLSHVYNQLD
jgi:hypothetical protein